MREIKFRAWEKPINKESGQMLYDILQYVPDWYGHKDYELMQYTGLKDMNGKEIYEGDILSGHADGLVVVEFGTSSWNCVFKDKETIGLDEMCVWFGNDSHILGNIYENPELLNLETV